MLKNKFKKLIKYSINSHCTKSAFTLSEVLITLMLIGVIASMTMPTLITNINEQKNLMMLKKLYSSFTVNIQSVLNTEYGTHCDSLSCLRKWTSVAGKHNGVLADTRYFNVRGECVGDCLNDYFDENTIFPTNIEYNNGDPNASLYLLPNSAAILIYDAGSNCNTPMHSVVEEDDADADPDADAAAEEQPVDFKYCSIIMFDTNGFKGPNSPCYDRFAFYLANTPYGYNNDDNDIHFPPSYLVPFGYSNPDGDGEFNCTAKIMLNGWKKTE